MRNIDVLKMINEGHIDELKEKLRDEIYADALKNKPGAKKRYSAMKKYFGYFKTKEEICQKPCLIEFEGKPHTSFCNSYSLALTTEPCGGIELFTDVDRYLAVDKLVRRDGLPGEIDFGKVFAEAKSMGYRLKKSELNTDKCKYFMSYNGAYFKLGLIDITYSIIDNGGKATVYCNGSLSPMTIENDIGVCTIMPVNMDKLEIGREIVVTSAD